MWICKFCETENEDGYSVCICCGNKRGDAHYTAAHNGNGIVLAEGTAKRASTKSHKKATIIIITVFAVLAVLAIGFFTIHDWQPATCIEPETCTICGKTRTLATGHEWIPATCTEPEICKVCGENRAPAAGHKWTSATCTESQKCEKCGTIGEAALGHDWRDATYSQPQTCARCGYTTGNVKGYIGVLNGVVSSEDVHVRGGQWSKALELAEPLDRCIKMTMELTVTDYSGDPFGAWCLYGRIPDGKWEYIGDFNIDERFINETLKTQFTFDPYVSFDALTMVQKDEQKYDINYTFKFSDAQHYID